MAFAGMATGGQEGTGSVDGKRSIVGGAYRVDAAAVAEAMLRHPGVRRLLGAPPLSPAGARSPAAPPRVRRRG